MTSDDTARDDETAHENHTARADETAVENEYSIHDQDPGPLKEPRADQQVPPDLLDDGPTQVVESGRGPHERGAGVRSPGGGDDVVANDTP